MTTIKSYTDIEQSKKLIESGIDKTTSDMHYEKDSFENYYSPIPLIGKYSKIHDQLPCWSLTALFNVLPNGTDVVKEEADTENERYMCTVGINDNIISTFANNPVDACVEMILKLKENKSKYVLEK